ncbi:hypothetical protein SprV_0401435900 [Sparganum proliferum]
MLVASAVAYSAAAAAAAVKVEIVVSVAHEEIKGTPIGSQICGLIVEAVLQELERRLPEEYKLKVWACYVDETFVIVDRHKINCYADLLNSIIHHLQFTMEGEHDHPQIRLLTAAAAAAAAAADAAAATATLPVSIVQTHIVDIMDPASHPARNAAQSNASAHSGRRRAIHASLNLLPAPMSLHTHANIHAFNSHTHSQAQPSHSTSSSSSSSSTTSFSCLS